MLAVAPRLKARRDAPQHAALLGAAQARPNLPTRSLARVTAMCEAHSSGTLRKGVLEFA